MISGGWVLVTPMSVMSAELRPARLAASSMRCRTRVIRSEICITVLSPLFLRCLGIQRLVGKVIERECQCSKREHADEVRDGRVLRELHDQLAWLHPICRFHQL